MQSAEPDRDPEVIAYLRRVLQAALANWGAGYSTAMPAVNTVRRAGESKLARSAGVYITRNDAGDTVVRVKPSWAQWTNEVHAAATRASGQSRELIGAGAWLQARQCRQLHMMPSDLIADIAAVIHPDPPVRALARLEVAGLVSRELSTELARKRAFWMARTYFATQEAGTKRAYEALGMSQAEWRGSRLYRVFLDVRAEILDREADALQSWASRCDAAGVYL